MLLSFLGTNRPTSFTLQFLTMTFPTIPNRRENIPVLRDLVGTIRPISLAVNSHVPALHSTNLKDPHSRHPTAHRAAQTGVLSLPTSALSGGSDHPEPTGKLSHPSASYKAQGSGRFPLVVVLLDFSFFLSFFLTLESDSHGQLDSYFQLSPEVV